MFRSLIPLALTTVILAGCSSDQTPQGGLSSEGDLLIASPQTGNWEVFIFDVGASMVFQVTEAPGFYVARWERTDNPEEESADAYVEGFDLEPAWSPDGKRIVLSSDRGADGFGLYIVNRAGSVEKQLTDFRGANQEPAWSPDGSQIAFRSDKSGDVELYVMGVDGSDVRQLTDSRSEDWTPDWSPDGTSLAFASRRANGSWDIFTMRADGTDLAQLTDDAWDNWLPAWSPDGTSLAFAANPGGNWDIFVMDSSGGSIRQITDDPSDDVEPVWSPDGNQLAFASKRTASIGSPDWKVFFADLSSDRISGSGQTGYPTDWFSGIGLSD